MIQTLGVFDASDDRTFEQESIRPLGIPKVLVRSYYISFSSMLN